MKSPAKRRNFYLTSLFDVETATGGANSAGCVARAPRPQNADNYRIAGGSCEEALE